MIARNSHVWRESCLRLFSIQSAYAAALIAPLIAAPATAQSNSIPSSPVSGGAAELMKDDKQWPMAAKNFANTRFSGLDQINNQNVGELRLAWTFSVGAPRGQEAAPIAVDGTVFVVAPYAGVHPNEIFALDAATGDLKWSYAPKPNLAAEGVACCDVVNRGLAYDNGKIFLNTLDDYSVAIDANTGKELWHTKLGDINLGETITMAPLVVKGKVLVGNSGGEMGVRGWLAAVDENTGNIAWRAYSTGPDADVLIGEDFKPPYDWMKGKDLGAASWPPGAWKIGGGTVWGWISYDPALNLIYYGTSNPSTWNHEQRPGDNLWTSALFARDPDTGRAKWAYSLGPHDLWDYDEINENIILDLNIDNQTRKVIVHPGRNGFMYVIDRATGHVISADKYDTVNTIEIDRPAERAACPQRGTHPPSPSDCPRCVSGIPRRKGLAAGRLVAAHAVALRAAPTFVHEFSDQRSGIHRRHALRRRQRRHVCRTRWVSRRIHGVGPGQAHQGVVDQREFSGLERSARHRRRRRLLRDHGSVV